MERMALIDAVKTAQAVATHRRYTKLERMYPEAGPLRRAAYPKQMAVFRAGKEHRERLILGGNRVGKTEGVGGYEVACHLTGRYPDWWEGHVFDGPILCWAAGDTAGTTRDIQQCKLLGPVTDPGSGLIPKQCLARTRNKPAFPDAVESAWIRHESGGDSIMCLKSYDQKRRAYYGNEVDLIWLDEEAPLDIYEECLMRTMTTNGRIILTCTALNGWTPLLRGFLPDNRMPAYGVEVETLQ